jgi:squalene-hopene/tetraprenyl-beta-curcumene cyclase
MKSWLLLRRSLLVMLLTGVLSPLVVHAALPSPEMLQWKKSVDDGVAFLKSTQNADGSWSNNTKTIGISGICTAALLNSEIPPSDETVQKALKFLEKYVQTDGGIYHPQTNHKNYETSIVLMALVVANDKGQYTKTIDNAIAFLKNIQWDEGEQTPEDNPAFGGQGYGSHKRPDLSNTQFFLEALTQAGISSNDESFQKALTFVSRAQNHVSPHNTTGFAEKVNDGGFYYTPAAGGSSQAGATPEGGLRSYGSMTYAGLKSMIYCGVNKDDSRFKAALTWIGKFYTLDENPGMGQQGLFYYYHTFAKSLSALGSEEIVDATGVKHQWKQELLKQLTTLQKDNGSWVNPTDRWYEGDPQIVTAYGLLAMKYCRPKE